MDADSLRKAAILINSLDSRTADALLDQMSEEQSNAVRRAVMDLVDIDPVEQEAVIAAFMASQRGGDPPIADSDGRNPYEDEVEFSTELTPSAPTAREPHFSDETRLTGEGAALFAFLHRVDPASVHAFLAPEHPQTVAIVLAHLPPKQAADVIRLLATETQSDVLRRIASLNGADVQVLRDIEEEMRQVFASRSFNSGDAHGVSSLQAILAATDKQERSAWLQDIEAFDPQIAEKLHQAPAATEFAQNEFALPKPAKFPRLLDPADAEEATRALADFSERQPQPLDNPGVAATGGEESALENQATNSVRRDEAILDKHDGAPDAEAPMSESQIAFDLLYQLDDGSLAKVLQRSPQKVVLLALAGAQRTFVERLLKQLPSKAAKAFNKRIEQVGPLRLKDVETAQRKMASVAEQLADDGEIELPQPRRFAAAA